MRRGSKELCLLDDSGVDRNCAMLMFPIPAGVENARQLYISGGTARNMKPSDGGAGKTASIPAGTALPTNWKKGGRPTPMNTGQNQRDLLHIVDGSFLEEYDDFNIR